MTNLLVFREQLKKFYSKYELYITPLCKFLLALVSLLVINSRIGYMSTLKNAAVVLILALHCCVGSFSAIVHPVFQVFTKGYTGSIADSYLFCTEDTLCNADSSRIDRYTGIFCSSSKRCDRVLHACRYE